MACTVCLSDENKPVKMVSVKINNYNYLLNIQSSKSQVIGFYIEA